MTAETLAQPWIPSDTFGARLALIRQRMRWNTATAAKECGVSNQSWHRWEHDKLPQDMASVCRAISNRTGCNYTWLMVGSAGGLTLSTKSQQPQLFVLPGGANGVRRQPELPFLRPVPSE